MTKILSIRSPKRREEGGRAEAQGQGEPSETVRRVLVDEKVVRDHGKSPTPGIRPTFVEPGRVYRRLSETEFRPPDDVLSKPPAHSTVSEPGRVYRHPAKELRTFGSPGSVYHSTWEADRQAEGRATEPRLFDKESSYMLGETEVTVRQVNGERLHGIKFVRLHADETTAGRVAPRFVTDFGGNLFCLYDPIGRGKFKALNFRMTYPESGEGTKSQYYADPNSFFLTDVQGAPAGEIPPQHLEAMMRVVRKSKKRVRRRDVESPWADGEKEAAAKKLYGFSRWFLRQMSIPSSELVVGLHNNRTRDEFNVRIRYDVHRSAQVDGRVGADGEVMANIPNPREPQNFFLTTDERDYLALLRMGFNVVLQKEAKDLPPTNNSLSAYCARVGVRYILIETQEGDYTAHLKMLNAIARLYDPQDDYRPRAVRP